MERQVDDSVFEIMRIMKVRYEKDLTIYDEAFLVKTLRRRMAAIAINPSDYVLYLQKNRDEAESLVGSFQISYSQFFRNGLTFAVLEQLVLPQLLSHKPENGEIRVWSAGCSTGQEAYSIAILLEELLISSSKPMRFRIFATDLSSEALDTARTGVYDEDSLSNVRMKYIKRYFSKMGAAYQVVPGLTEKIVFSQYDLLDAHSTNPPDSIYGDFDMIFCCNLLFYYQTPVRRSIVKKLKRSLAEGGFLITGEAESLFMGNDQNLKMLSASAPVFQIN